MLKLSLQCTISKLGLHCIFLGCSKWFVECCVITISTAVERNFMVIEMLFNLILPGVLVSLRFSWMSWGGGGRGGGQKFSFPLTLEIYILLIWNLLQKFIQTQTIKKYPKGSVCCPNFDINFHGNDKFYEKSRFKISTLIWWESYFWANMLINLMLLKFYEIFILISTVNICRKDFCFFSSNLWKSGCGRLHQQWYFNICLTYVCLLSIKSDF